MITVKTETLDSNANGILVKKSKKVKSKKKKSKFSSIQLKPL